MSETGKNRDTNPRVATVGWRALLMAVFPDPSPLAVTGAVPVIMGGGSSDKERPKRRRMPNEKAPLDSLL